MQMWQETAQSHADVAGVGPRSSNFFTMASVILTLLPSCPDGLSDTALENSASLDCKMSAAAAATCSEWLAFCCSS
jgi:hypothetical protein